MVDMPALGRPPLLLRAGQRRPVQPAHLRLTLVTRPPAPAPALDRLLGRPQPQLRGRPLRPPALLGPRRVREGGRAAARAARDQCGRRRQPHLRRVAPAGLGQGLRVGLLGE